MLKKLGILSVLALGLLAAGSASAIPVLQLYVEGGTYNEATETWLVEDDTFRLWVIGDVGSYGTISDVKLSMAYATSEIGTATLVSGTTGDFGGFTDPSAPGAPVQTIFGGNDGDQPLMSDGDPLPAHGVYGDGTSFLQWELGDYTLTDSPIDDFITAFPTSPFPSTGQINVYDVTITGFTAVHFDTFDNIEGGNDIKVVFAPFSHDAGSGGSGGNGGSGGGGGSVPEPGMLALFGTGLVGLVGSRLRRK